MRGHAEWSRVFFPHSRREMWNQFSEVKYEVSFHTYVPRHFFISNVTIYEAKYGNKLGHNIKLLKQISQSLQHPCPRKQVGRKSNQDKETFLQKDNRCFRQLTAPISP